MDRLTLTMKTTNAAFEDHGGEPSFDAVADVLAELANDIRHGQTRGRIMDANGNHVGDWEWR